MKSTFKTSTLVPVNISYLCYVYTLRILYRSFKWLTDDLYFVEALRTSTKLICDLRLNFAFEFIFSLFTSLFSLWNESKVEKGEKRLRKEKEVFLSVRTFFPSLLSIHKTMFCFWVSLFLSSRCKKSWIFVLPLSSSRKSFCLFIQQFL